VKLVIDTDEASKEQGDYWHILEHRMITTVAECLRDAARTAIPEAYGDEDAGMAERFVATADMLEQARDDWWGKYEDGGPG